jgi:hypothetical protein
MTWRFRRTLKIAPGVRLNIGKRSVSTRFGPRGAGLTIGTKGTTVSAGIPGTGLHASQRLRNEPRSASGTSASQGDGRSSVWGWLAAEVIAVIALAALV